MEIKKIFAKYDQSSPSENKEQIDCGGTGFLPALGNLPAFPALPAVEIPPNQPKVPEPSPESIEESNQIVRLFLDYSLRKGK